jgi:hypothetical protein
MFKILVGLAIGLAIGYNYGWHDSRNHEKIVYERLVDRIGGGNRDLFAADSDSLLAPPVDP